MEAQITFIHALSSLHAGIGQGAGVIDLPIAREKTTGIPYLPGSSLKGALRSRSFSEAEKHPGQVTISDGKKIDIKERSTWIFGPANSDDDNSSASQVQLTDQRLLLLPIRSLKGTFAWVTSPFILRRLLRDLAEIQGEKPALKIPSHPITNCLLASNETLPLTIKDNDSNAENNTHVYLEDLDLQIENNTEETSKTKDWAEWLGKKIFPDKKGENGNNQDWRGMFTERFCIVHDTLFSFLLQTGTEVNARIRLQETTKTVTSGGLWYEETLPVDTILTGMALAMPVTASPLQDEDVLDHIHGLTDEVIQLGGKATVGRGLCKVIVTAE